MRYLFILSAFLAVITLWSFRKNPGLAVHSSAFTSNGMIPSKYSCEGTEVSPPLHVANVPSKARSLALIVHDPDAPKAGGMTHWVVWNIPTDGTIEENFSGAVQGLNGANENKYKGMCPPTGIHHYHFKVYALDTKLNIDRNTDKSGLEKAMRGHILSEGELVGLYKKMK